MNQTPELVPDLECPLRQSQRLETLGTLAGGIAHDFNNQLTVILNNLSFSLELVESEHAARSCLADALRAAQRCADMTQGLLAFSRRVKPVLRPARLDRLMDETERLLRRVLPASIAVRFTRSPDLQPVLADATQIQQVLMNLAVNAQDAMPGGGILEVGAENAGGAVVITVSDTGMGMAPEVRQRIFEPFFTTKMNQGGTGLGLATVQRIVKEHGGAIEVESAPGRGSRFRITIPAAPSAENRLPEEPVLQPIRATVLVVEDDDLVRRAAVTILRLNGCRTLEARDGEEGLAVFREHGEGIDLVFTDLSMPRRGGISLIEQLRLLRPGVRTLLASGYAEQPSGPFLPKPYSARDLIRKVQELLVADL